MKMNNDEFKACCICGKKIEINGNWIDDNNAEPVKKGRCCNNCNFKYVIPARLGVYNYEN